MGDGRRRALKKKTEEDPLARLRERRDHLVLKLAQRAPRAKREEIEQDMRHIEHLGAILELAEERADAPKRPWRTVALASLSLLVVGVTLVLMWRRPSSAAVRLEVETRSLQGRLGDGAEAIELPLQLALEALVLSPLEVVEHDDRLFSCRRLTVRDERLAETAVRLLSVGAPPRSLLRMERDDPDRLVLRIEPPAGASVSCTLDLGEDLVVRASDDEHGLADSLASIRRRSRVVARAAPGTPLVIGATLRARGDPEPRTEARPLVLDGFLGLELSELAFLDEVADQAQAPMSTLLAGTCYVSGAEPIPVELRRAEKLVAERWTGKVTRLELHPDGLRLDWQGTALRPMAGYEADRRHVLPVLFQYWLGTSPRSYVSVILVYVSLVPIFGILRALVGSRIHQPVSVEDIE